MKHYPDRSQMQAPGVCIICELTPNEGEGVVDTTLNFEPGFVSALTGRKYVCDGCIKSIGQAAGLYATADVETANQAAGEALARYNAIRDHVAKVGLALTDVALLAAGDASSYVSSRKSAETGKKPVTETA